LVHCLGSAGSGPMPVKINRFGCVGFELCTRILNVTISRINTFDLPWTWSRCEIGHLSRYIGPLIHYLMGYLQTITARASDTKMLILKNYESIMANRAFAPKEQMLHFRLCFQKSNVVYASKCVCMRYRVKLKKQHTFHYMELKADSRINLHICYYHTCMLVLIRLQNTQKNIHVYIISCLRRSEHHGLYVLNLVNSYPSKLFHC